MSKRDINELVSLLEKVIGEKLGSIEPLKTSITHSSFVNESEASSRDHNERLEFLGDAVLSLAISDALVRRFPKKREGQLSRFRAAMVNEKTLASAARDIQLGDYLRLGKGEERTRGREKDSILADAYEALLAAIYISNGFMAAATFVLHTLEKELDKVHKVTHRQDFKTNLQELTQRMLKTTPVYKLVEEEGPDHNKIFESEVWINNRIYGRGKSRSKKDSEQICAEEALKSMKAEFDEVS